MKLFYIANARIPTEKAHGLTIVKSCEAFADAGVETILVLPKRKTPFKGDIFETYGVHKNFSVRYLAVPDLIFRSSSKFAFFATSAFFYWRVKVAFLFTSRKNTIMYTRDILPALTLSILGFTVAFECHHISKWRRTFFFLARSAHRIVVISQALKNAFIEGGIAAERIVVAPSGVDLRLFDIQMFKDEARRECKLPQDSSIALYTGNFTTMGEDKGISDILDALVYEPGVLFVAVGGSEKDIARYMAEASLVGVSNSVKFFGHVSQATLAKFQKAADVLLMPFPDTPHYRNHMSPVKMFEYMASGRPIIATDLPTIREVLNEENAVIVPPGDAEQLASAIRDLIQDAERRERIAKHAYADVAAYSWERRSKTVLSQLGV